uniref:SURP and G-patch domain containing 1 n=1 Tax=Ascaris lumbricoides TaxID=6252 RepID=A0A0M3IB70_ASCLU
AAESQDDPEIAGPSRITKRYCSTRIERKQNNAAEFSDFEENSEEMRKRKRLDEEALLLKENEARFGKRPEYGTREYFEWVGLLYGMPPTGSVPELKDSSDEEEDWEEEEQEEDCEDTENDKRELSQGTVLQEASMAVSEQPFIVPDGHPQASFGPPQPTSSNDPKGWLKATIAEVHNGIIAPPKKDIKELHEQELQLKMKEMELNTELLKIKTDQMKLKNWYVMQAGQIDPLPTDVLLEEGAKFVNELRVRAIKEGRLVNKPQSLKSDTTIKYDLDENGEVKTYLVL